MGEFRNLMQIGEGREWERFAGLKMDATLEHVPCRTPSVGSPTTPSMRYSLLRHRSLRRSKVLARSSTSWRAARKPARHHFARCDGLDRSQRLRYRPPIARKPPRRVSRAEGGVRAESPRGRRVELGIAENNLLLDSAGAWPQRNLVRRAPAADRHALRSLHPARAGCAERASAHFQCWWQKPSGITLSPEGARESIGTPLIRMAQPGMSRARLPRRARAWNGVSATCRRRRAGRSASLGRSGSTAAQPGRRQHERERRLLAARTSARSKLAIAYVGAVAPEAIAAPGRPCWPCPQRRIARITSMACTRTGKRRDSSITVPGARRSAGNVGAGRGAEYRSRRSPRLVSWLCRRPAHLSAGRRSASASGATFPDLYRIDRRRRRSSMLPPHCIDGWGP